MSLVLALQQLMGGLLRASVVMHGSGWRCRAHTEPLERRSFPLDLQSDFLRLPRVDFPKQVTARRLVSGQ